MVVYCAQFPYLLGCFHGKLGERLTAVFSTDLQQRVPFGIYSDPGVAKHFSDERQVCNTLNFRLTLSETFNVLLW